MKLYRVNGDDIGPDGARMFTSKREAIRFARDCEDASVTEIEIAKQVRLPELLCRLFNHEQFAAKQTNIYDVSGNLAGKLP